MQIEQPIHCACSVRSRADVGRLIINKTVTHLGTLEEMNIILHTNT